MNSENMLFASKTIDIAENDLFIELVNRMCYYDDENLNHVVLPYKGCEEAALNMARSLINMPVQAKYRKINGNDDLGSHEAYINQDGEMEFLTESIGVHVDCWIEESEVTTVNGENKVLPCLFAKKRIWKRNKNMVNAVKRLYESAEGLGSSWEIQTLEYSFKNGKKYLSNYLFLSDCLLGSTTTPAYSGTSKALSMTAEQLMIAEALSLDMKSESAFSINEENSNKEETILNKDNLINASETSEEVVETPVVEEPVAEEAQVAEPVAEPEAPVAEETSVKKEDEEKDGNPEDEKPEDDEEKKKEKSESDTSEIAELNKVIAEKDEIILKASSEITELKARVAELSQYKEKFEKAEQEKIEAELAEKKEELIASVVKSGHMTREEIESSEDLKGFVEALDKASLMAIIGERLISSLETVETPAVETSETSEKVRIATNLNESDEDVLKDSASVMRKYLRK